MSSFINSVLFGSRGDYKFCGVNINFESGFRHRKNAYPLTNSPFLQDFHKATHRATFGYAHVLTRELGQAFMARCLGFNNREEYNNVSINTDECVGSMPTFSNDWKDTVIKVAGSISNIAFSSCQLVTAVALKDYISWPISTILGGGALTWMATELLYQNGYGFSTIPDSHRNLSSIALITSCALGISTAIKFI
jgi:hypothetical protein